MSEGQKDTKDIQTKEKKPRHRSPSYPAIGLRESVERLRKLYETDGKAGAPPDIAAMHIGFSSAHGQAMSVLSALKKFGLIAEANNRVVPTQRGIEILMLPEYDARRRIAINEALNAPEIYSELIEQHKQTGFPSSDALERELVTYRNFNPNAVAGFVKDLKDSLEFAGVTDTGAVDSGKGSETMNPETQSNKTTQTATDPSSAFKKKVIDAFLDSQQTVYSWPLSKDVAAQLILTGDVKASHIETLQLYLNIVKNALQTDGSN